MPCMREPTVQRTLRLRESTVDALSRIDETSENAFIERAVRQELQRLGLLASPAPVGGEVEQLREEIRRLRQDLEDVRRRVG